MPARLLAFAGRRLVSGALVLLFIIFLSYLGLDMAAGTKLVPAATSALPNTAAYIGRLAHMDLGLTQAGSDTLLPLPVTQVLAERLPRSLGLLLLALLLASVLGILLGITAARSRSGRSLGVLISTIVGISLPSFFAAFLLQLGATSYTRFTGQRLLPVGGFGWDKHLILPVLVLSARPIAQITRITFVSVQQALRQDYIRTARGKGLHNLQIMLVHVMRNAAIPILTTIGVSLRFSLSSLPVVEYYFGWPGAGFTLLKGIAQQDTDLTIALSLSLAIMFILINLILETSYRVIDPRLGQFSPTPSGGEKRHPKAWLGQLLKRLRGVRSASYARASWHLLPRAAEPLPPLPTAQSKNDSALILEDAGEQPRSRKLMWMATLRNYPLIVGSLMVAALLIVLFLGQYLTPNIPYHTQGLVKIDGVLTPPPFPPGERYPWGTDLLGRGIMSLIIAGARQTLTLGILVVAARTAAGVILGLAAGWWSGSSLDRLILGLAEIISAFPTLLLAMILILAIGIRQGMTTFVIALCLVGWDGVMQYVRSEVITIRPKPYIESAIAAGARSRRIITRHILPNLFAALISITALEMGAVLMLLGELGFLSIFIGGGALFHLPTGAFLYSDVPEWGALLSDVRYQARSYPWTALYPMLAFFVSILSFNLLGEGIRRRLDEGRLIISRLINRYTVALLMLMAIGIYWLQINSGVTSYYKNQASVFDSQRALAHVAALADENWSGRALGTEGMGEAADYIAAEFEALGLQPAGRSATFFQERKRSFEQLETVPLFSLQDGGAQPVYGRDFAVYPGRNMSQGKAESPIRFIGLGQPLGNLGQIWRLAYPDLDRASFDGEILLTRSAREAAILSGVPKDGLLVVTEDPTLVGQRFTLSGRSGKWLSLSSGEWFGEETPSLWISEEMAQRLLTGSGESLDTLDKTVAQLVPEAVYQLPLNASAEMQVEGTLVEQQPVRNVLGYIPGTEGFDLCETCLGKQLIVVMAQYDSPPQGPEGVYPAANDNASGVAVMLEAIRLLQQTDYQPYKTFLFIAYAGEGLDGGEPIIDSDVNKFLQAKVGFSQLNLEAIVIMRGLGGGSGNRLEISAGGSLRLADMFEKSARRMGTGTVRTDENVNLGIIYQEGSSFQQSGQKAPVVRLFWDGWEQTSRTSADHLTDISADKLEASGRALALSLMILGRETEY